MLNNEQVNQILGMLAEHVEGTNQNEMMHFAREKKWNIEELKMALETITNIVMRRDN